MTRSLPILLFISLMLLSLDASAQVRQSGNFGIGIGSGTFASGLSMKYFMGDALSVQGNVGLYRYRRYWYDDCYDKKDRRYRSCGKYGDALALSADILSERPTIVGNGKIDLAWHVGGGLGLALFESAPVFDLAAAFVLGLQLDINVIPIDIVVEYRPKVVVTAPAFDLVDFTAHIRYFF